MNTQTNGKGTRPVDAADFRTYYFADLLKRPVCAGKISNRLGRLSDLVFRISEPYPEAVGIYLFHGWGRPTEFIPWDKVIKIADDAVFVQPTPDGGPYPPFEDQPGYLLVNEHLMGQTILDMDGRRTEVVNDVHLLESQGRMLVIHVDVSFNGFWRRWGLRFLIWHKDRFINWRYVQPLSVEDTSTDTMLLSIARNQIKDLPSEDLADVLEALSGPEQQALFSALDSEKAADALGHAEPRAQRQIVANLRRERAQKILSEMSVPRVADLLAVLPHDDMTEMMSLLPPDQAERVHQILAERESTAGALISSDFLAMEKDAPVGDVLRQIRASGRDPHSISYIFITNRPENVLQGVVDLRDLVLAADTAALGDIMVSPVVTADEHDTRENLEDLFTRYHFRMIPVVDSKDHLLGVINHNDIMQGLLPRART
jgi:CBS domain-containing protein/uncharacterized protein YrrD